MIDHLMLLSLPGIRPGDLHDINLTPTLYRLAHEGAWLTFAPTFPCLTSSVQAAMLTGRRASEHGVVANGCYDPERQTVAFWNGCHNMIESPTFFTKLTEAKPGLKSAVWNAQNIRGAAATFVVSPGPVRGPDSLGTSGCYTKPESLYNELVSHAGTLPIGRYWSPKANAHLTKWILEGALWLAKTHTPNFHLVCLPHLEGAAQKYGPNSEQAAEGLAELDTALADFIDRYEKLSIAKRTAWLLVGEYVTTPVSQVIYPNRILREAGLLKVREERGREYVDWDHSDAFAMVDHQVAHVFVNRGDANGVADLFRAMGNIGDLVVGRERSAMGVEHPRSAPVILISRPDGWFSYYWWHTDDAAPPFARMVGNSSKLGYDPMELFVDPVTGRIPLDAALVKGSHGAPVTQSEQRTILITTHPELLEGLPSPARDVDLFSLLCRVFGVEAM